MLRRERLHGARGGKLAEALRQLTTAAREYLEEQKPFPEEWLWSLYRRWQAWRRGIVPTTQPAGYGAQNPYLLDAFAVLDQAAEQAERKREYAREKRQLELIQALLSR